MAQQLRQLSAEGLLPPWNEWFPPGTLEAILPDADTRSRFIAELPRLPLTFFQEPAPISDGWERVPFGYLRLSQMYDVPADQARELGWPVPRYEGHHLSMLTDPTTSPGTSKGSNPASVDEPGQNRGAAPTQLTTNGKVRQSRRRRGRLHNQQDQRPGIAPQLRPHSADRETLAGRTVGLVADHTQDDRDRYDRALRYVILPAGLNYSVLAAEAGAARSYIYDSPVSEHAAIIAAEQRAKAADAGLWGPPCFGAENTAEPAPQPEPEPQPEPAGNCAPGYDPCVPPYPPDVDCADVNGPITVTGSDPHGLDGDDDGTACE
jgi:hypothetical protein